MSCTCANINTKVLCQECINQLHEDHFIVRSSMKKEPAQKPTLKVTLGDLIQRRQQR